MTEAKAEVVELIERVLTTYHNRRGRSAEHIYDALLSAGIVGSGWRAWTSETPDHYVKVLGYWDNGECHVGQLCEDGRWLRDMDKARWSFPTHWQPLPAPPLPLDGAGS